MSGWATNNKAIIKVNKKENKYFKYTFLYFSLLKIRLIKIIKKGLTSSIGWNLGKKYKSIHLWALFTSTPMIGTKNNDIKEMRKITGEILNSFSLFIEDKIKIIIMPRSTKDKCLKKNV